MSQETRPFTQVFFMFGSVLVSGMKIIHENVG